MINVLLKRPRFAGGGELAEIPGVLAEEIGVGLFGDAGEVLGVGLGGALDGEFVGQAAAGGEGADLDEEAVAFLERGQDGAGALASEEVAVEGGEGGAQIAAKKRLGCLEKIALGEVGREGLHIGLGDDERAAGGFGGGGGRVGVGGEFIDLGDEETGVGAGSGEEELKGVGLDGDAEGAGLGEGGHGEGLHCILGSGGADEGEVGDFFAPLVEALAAVNGGGGDENGDLGGVDGGKNGLEVLDGGLDGLGVAGAGVGEEVDVLEPHETAAAEHGYGLHAVAEAGDGGLGLVHGVDETTDGLAGEFVLDGGGELVVAGLAEAADEEVVGAADEGERFGGVGGGHGGMKPRKVHHETGERHEKKIRQAGYA